MKWPVVFIGVILLVGVLLFTAAFGMPGTRGAATVSTATSTTEILEGVSSITHSNPDYNFTIKFPSTAEVFSSGFKQYFHAVDHEIVGFRMPQSIYDGTNLIEAALYVGESGDRVTINSCLTATREGEAYLGEIWIQHTNFKIFLLTGAATGNMYDGRSYRTIRDGHCFEIVQLLHSGNIGNYPVGQVRQYDREQVIGVLDRMIGTFGFIGESGSGVEGKLINTCKSDQQGGRCSPQIVTIEAYQGVSSVALFKTKEDGTFRAKLPAGQYELRVNAASTTRCVSVGVVVQANSYISTNISCDVGQSE